MSEEPKERTRELKPVSFNLNSEYDVKLLEHTKSTGIKFGAYVKSLIAKDMQNSSNNNLDISNIVNAINKLTETIENKSFTAIANVKDECSIDVIEDKPKSDVVEEKKLSEEEIETKSIIDGILNFGR